MECFGRYSRVCHSYGMGNDRMSEKSHRSKLGLVDFILQRLSAVVIAIYMIHLVIIFSLNSDMDYVAWREYFKSGYALILASLAVISIVIHGWIGLWTIGTDYIRSNGAMSRLGLAYQVAVVVVLVAYLFWALSLIWGTR